MRDTDSHEQLQARVSALEAENERLKAQLDTRKNDFETFMDNSPATAFYKDADGRLLYINKAFIEAFDFADRDWRGKTDFELWDRTTAEALRENDLRILSTSQAEAVEEDVIQEDGIHHWLTHKFCFHDAQGNKYLGGMGVDLPEQKNKDKLLRAAGEKAANASREKAKFLSLIIQELRTPLYSILASSELWTGNGEVFDQDELAKFVNLGATKLRSQLENLVLLAETDNEDLQPGHFEFELLPLVERMVGYTEGNIQEGVEFRVEYKGSVPARFIGDSYLIEHMIRTVLENACRHTAQGYICLAIGWDPTDHKLAFKVTDTGTGISYEKRRKIYEEVVKVSRGVDHELEHIGLGLTVGYRLGELLQADTEMHSREGQGTSVRMAVPLEEVDSFRSTTGKTATGKCNILLVEDDPMDAEFMQAILSDMGQQVTVARSGAVALELLGEQVYDLIFMDIHMPIMDGLTTTRWIHRRGVNTPIIAIMHSDDQAARQRCIQIGMKDILNKPVRKSDLLRILERQKIV